MIMMHVSAVFFVLLSIVCVTFTLRTDPTQIHISAADVNTDIVVTWITFDPTPSSLVRYNFPGSTIPYQVAQGAMTSYKDIKLTRYVHRVTLNDLNPNQHYVYQCGSASNWSSNYTMKTLPKGNGFSPATFLVYGDFGYSNAQSISLLTQHVTAGDINAILHIGDFAYNLFSEDGTQGDKFMDMIQPLAARVPYMTVPGNHEFLEDFKDYRNRFSMPGGHDSIYYSLNVGPAHIIMFSTEVYFFYETISGLNPIKEQYEWLEKDLKQASTPEALKERPWIIAMAHRPMYCSTGDPVDCERERSRIRTGLANEYGLEKLFYEHGVDLFAWAHEHIYERMWPVYDLKVMNGSYNHPYTNPRAPVHIVTGSAGCRERHSKFDKYQPDYVAFTNSDYGFTKMKVHNKTHITIEQISDDQKGKIVDSFTLIKTVHGPDAYKQGM